MANTKDIRAKITSTIKTQQTTKAMKMVSAAKLRRAQNAIVNARPYARKIESVIQKIAATQKVSHPLLEPREKPSRLLLVVLTSDRGLCGGFNNAVIKHTNQLYNEYKNKYEQVDFIFIGRRGSDFFKKRGIQPIDTILNLAGDIRYHLAAVVSEKLINAYLEDDPAQAYDEIRIIYNEFKSAISQQVVEEVLLPIQQSKLNADDNGNGATYSKDVIFEPAPEKIIEQLLLKHLTIQVYRTMQESVAAEHGARMAAMENATKNAGEMIRNLTLMYNKIRQAAITTELIEITSGAEALNS